MDTEDEGILSDGFHEVDEFGEDMEPLDDMVLDDDGDDDPDSRFT